MPKKKTEQEPEPISEVVPEAVPEVTPAQEPEKPKANPHYTLGDWAGYPKWQCNYCGYDTLEGETDILEHVYQRHLAPQAPQPPTQSLILLADKSGREKKGN
jgi:hypothetical protein